MVRQGLVVSSIRYSVRRDGRAIVIRIRAGRMVQIISISCTSVAFVWYRLVSNKTEIVYSTNMLIKKIIISVWS